MSCCNDNTISTNNSDDHNCDNKQIIEMKGFGNDINSLPGSYAKIAYYLSNGKGDISTTKDFIKKNVLSADPCSEYIFSYRRDKIATSEDIDVNSLYQSLKKFHTEKLLIGNINIVSDRNADYLKSLILDFDESIFVGSGGEGVKKLIEENKKLEHIIICEKIGNCDKFSMLDRNDITPFEKKLIKHYHNIETPSINVHYDVNDDFFSHSDMMMDNDGKSTTIIINLLCKPFKVPAVLTVKYQTYLKHIFKFFIDQLIDQLPEESFYVALINAIALLTSNYGYVIKNNCEDIIIKMIFTAMYISFLQYSTRDKLIFCDSADFFPIETGSIMVGSLSLSEDIFPLEMKVLLAIKKSNVNIRAGKYLFNKICSALADMSQPTTSIRKNIVMNLVSPKSSPLIIDCVNSIIETYKN